MEHLGISFAENEELQYSRLGTEIGVNAYLCLDGKVRDRVRGSHRVLVIGAVPAELFLRIQSEGSLFGMCGTR